jgi:MOSC domain-containing protein YiiM
MEPDVTTTGPWTIADLKSRHAQSGRVLWIGVRPGRREPMLVLDAVQAIAGRGLEGDRYRPGDRGARQVTLIQAEHLAVVGALLDRPAPDPTVVRRNILVAGINLLALKDARFRIGDVLLEGSGLCHPCSRMEEALGQGGYNAMRGHGGINARILEGGTICVGGQVVQEKSGSPELGPASAAGRRPNP